MDNEAATRYVIPQDEQVEYVAPVVLLTPAGVATVRTSLYGAIDPAPWYESIWRRISRGRVIGGNPKPQARVLPESEHPGLSPSAFEALRVKFGRG